MIQPRSAINIEWLRAEYIEKQVSMRNIACKLGVSQYVVYSTLLSNKISIRHHAGGAKPGQKYTSVIDYSLLRKKCLEERKSVTFIAAEIGTTVDHVRYSLKRHNIHLQPPRAEKFDGGFEDLRSEQQQLLVGTLVGDACISRGPYNSYRLRFGQKQLEYVKWKVSLLPEFFSNRIQPLTTTLKETQRSYIRYCATSYAHPIFAELRQIFYPLGIKAVTCELLKRLDAFGLAVWIMDNGIGNRIWPDRIGLATNSYTLAEQKVMRRWFAKQWNIQPTIQFSRGTYRLRFGVADSRRLANIIRPYVLPLFLYKINVRKPKI